MSWAKGTPADALESVCTQRKARHVLVNAAYTSQMDSPTGSLQGRRVGDKFYRENGDVLQADHNAAMNVLARLGDSEITRFTPYKEVRRILLTRSPAPLSVKRLELGVQARQPAVLPGHDGQDLGLGVRYRCIRHAQGRPKEPRRRGLSRACSREFSRPPHDTG